LLSLTGYEAFCFDQAVTVLNAGIEERMEKGVGKHKDAEKEALARSRWLTRYIGGPEAASKATGQFRDPASAF